MGSEWKALNLYTGNLLGPGEFSGSGVEILRTVMVGGSSMATIGNGVRSLQKEFLSAGIDLEDKYTEAEKELNIVPCPEENMGERTKRLVQASNELGYEIKPMPKFIDFSKCIGCGNCHLGCIYGAKWTSRCVVLSTSDTATPVAIGVAALSIKVTRAAGADEPSVASVTLSLPALATSRR